MYHWNTADEKFPKKLSNFCRNFWIGSLAKHWRSFKVIFVTSPQSNFANKCDPENLLRFPLESRETFWGRFKIIRKTVFFLKKFSDFTRRFCTTELFYFTFHCSTWASYTLSKSSHCNSYLDQKLHINVIEKVAKLLSRIKNHCAKHISNRCLRVLIAHVNHRTLNFGIVGPNSSF